LLIPQARAGEIDIIEGVHDNQRYQAAWHASRTSIQMGVELGYTSMRFRMPSRYLQTVLLLEQWWFVVFSNSEDHSRKAVP
jgi:hypothetical protein